MYRIGLIGNRAHQNIYGPIWNERSDCEIVAAAEHHAEKAGVLADLYGVMVTSDYDAVLEDPNVDIVSICTDFYLKRSLISKAVSCGKHVLVDKAIGRTVAEVREIVQIVDGGATRVMLAYPSRFSPTILRFKQAVDQSEYGRIVAYAHNSVKQFAGDLMAYVSYPTPAVQNGGGELMNLGSHAVDCMIWMFGLPKRVCCKMENAYFEEYAQYGTEDIATLWCDYDGFTTTLTVGRSKARDQDAMYDCIDVTGEGAWVRLGRGGYTANGRDVDLPDVQVKGSAGCVNHLIECIENDKPPISSARDGLAVAQVTTAAYQSAVCGDFVDLPLSDENHPLIDANDQLIDRLLD